ncbi:hypothetical protein ABW19_dt0204391 [Dactylella cylindrospora]|nr:hypothetical protein ABW19_dt0204391 [Dactylella cylindrospora]
MDPTAVIAATEDEIPLPTEGNTLVPLFTDEQIEEIKRMTREGVDSWGMDYAFTAMEQEILMNAVLAFEADCDYEAEGEVEETDENGVPR